MKNEFITEVTQQMLQILNNAELEKLQKILKQTLSEYELTKSEHKDTKEYLNYNLAG